MTTEEKGSVLKTKLGLENLKGLGDTLKQIKEVNESLVEAQKTVAELAKDNSPLGKALARLVEAQGLKTLNEDNINVSEEVRKTMAEELKNKDKTIEELAAENKGLKEDKVVSEVTSKVTAELDKRLPQPGAQTDGSGSKLFKAIEDVVAEKLEHLLGGSGEGTLTSEQIRKVVKEEVTAVAGGNKKPEDMVEDLVNALTVGDKLREKLGIPGIGGRLLQENPGGDSGLRTDLVKLLLEDERERLKMTQSHEVETERNRHIGTLAATVKENLGDGIAAISAAASEIKEGAKTPASESQPQVFRCGDCQTQFSPPAGWEGQPLKCPNPACGREYSKSELEGV
ncbi:unnamed protein product [marine sediment metagenome]|uniref:Uncharacterized protein n=1 Tax=marine sediment metagenome TaxID=412755 RepID=X1RRI2_9ZZZZ